MMWGGGETPGVKVNSEPQAAPLWSGTLSLTPSRSAYDTGRSTEIKGFQEQIQCSLPFAYTSQRKRMSVKRKQGGYGVERNNDEKL